MLDQTKSWPRLYGEGSNGNTKEWQITAHQDADGLCYTIAEFGGTGNKMQETRKEIPVGKQKRTTWEQAVSEAQSDFDKKVKKGYRESIAALKGLMGTEIMTEHGASSAKGLVLEAHSLQTNETTCSGFNVQGKPILPMLAHSYEKRSHDIKWPALAQAKIDGHRAYGTGGKLLSRGGDPVPGLVNMPHIQKELEKLSELLGDGVWYDGELYTEAIPFEKLSGVIRRARLTDAAAPLLPLVKYYLFDVFRPGQPDWDFWGRYNGLQLVLENNKFEHIVLVPITSVSNEQELMAAHDQYVQAGFEGAIVRNVGGVYKIGHRSADLQKFKRFQDAEFEITGFKEGTGSDAGSVVWQCQTPNGKDGESFKLVDFEVRPTGSLEYRRDLFNHGQEYIGKKLIVRYQNLSEYGIPRFPVGKGIREAGA